MNDMVYITFIFILFVGMGAIMPFVNDAIDNDYNGNYTLNENDIYDGMDTDSPDNIDYSDVFKSITKMFFWTFGELPLIIDSFFVIIRVIFIILIYRQFRSGGG